MKKKILSLLFGSLIMFQNGALFSVKATKGQEADIGLVPKIKPQKFDYCKIVPIDKDSALYGSADGRYYQTPFLCECYLISNKNLIRRFVGDKLIYVHINAAAPYDSPWIIFRAKSGKYICYQTLDFSREERDAITADVEKFKNSDICTLERLLANSASVILDTIS